MYEKQLVEETHCESQLKAKGTIEKLTFVNILFDEGVLFVAVGEKSS